MVKCLSSSKIVLSISQPASNHLSTNVKFKSPMKVASRG
jgi:hypothetical protein